MRGRRRTILGAALLPLVVILAPLWLGQGCRPAPRAPVQATVPEAKTFGPYHPYITTKALPKGVQGQPYYFQLSASGCPPKGCMWVVVGLPRGLRASAAGVISGTPTSSGSSNVTVTVL
jgi:hypothetical protein